MAGSSSGPPSLMETLFQRSLEDLIKALRADSPPSAAVLARAAAEARREIRASDPSTKAVAAQKLTFLCALHGVDVSSSAFHVLELLPSPFFLHKKLAYLAASLTFSPSTPVLPLATHQLRKDLSSPSDPAAALALELVASAAASADLARDLSAEISSLVSSPRPRLRLKASAASLRLSSLLPVDRLFLNLRSPDPRTVSSAINVFCELSAADPKPYLPLAPDFFRILVDSTNNWISIKVLKIFSRLAPLEPRLARRIADPICDHLRRCSAKSLAFECVRTIFTCLDGFDGAIKLAVEKIGEFLGSEDANLRFLGLAALSLLRPIHLWAVEENREVVARSLADADGNIRREALRLIMAMITAENLPSISAILLDHAQRSDPDFAGEILAAVMAASCRNSYELVLDVDWLVSLLGELARHPHFAMAEEAERRLVDVALRFTDARPELARLARDLLIDPSLLGNPALTEVLTAAAWLAGEYAEFARCHVELLEALLQPRAALLPVRARAVYLQAVFKVLVFLLGCRRQDDDDEDDDGESNRVLALIEASLDPLTESRAVELQDRARNVLGFVRSLKEARAAPGYGGLVDFAAAAFSAELVVPAGSVVVVVPDGILLRDDLSELDAILGSEVLEASSSSSSSAPPSSGAERRREQELFYLPKDDFPAAREAPRSDGDGGGHVGGSSAVDALIEKLVVTGTAGKMKMKARPAVVVKLDEGEKKKSSPRRSRPSPPVRDLLL